MKTSLPIFLLLLMLFSCKDKSVSAVEICGVRDPVRNLKWLSDKVEETKKNKEDEFMEIVAVKVKGETIINYHMMYMSCIGCYGFHCDGTPLDMTTLSQAELQEYQKNIWEESGKKIVLWPEK
ncbi:hypothetical protein [Dyadobacter luticola]|uniref:Lipoprotein n=1 Tax=Dyadobacter luticola TaxID=1979387 RepID=A0A5R9L529_9BACT|nr:hypothetical protein [Dyadobacter luticola]TLV03682.1 hypothetical protein FEN17_08795 [Dyadobacter luticola]